MYLSMGEQLNKLWYIYAMKYYSVMERNVSDTTDTQKTVDGSPENYAVRKENLSEIITWCSIPFTYNFKMTK